MKIFGRQIAFTQKQTLSPVASRRGWWPLVVGEPYTGAWQRNDEWSAETALAQYAVYACITLISNDFGKLRQYIAKTDDNGISKEVSSSAYAKLLRKPNRYQNYIQFKQWWITSKLITGNAYALKQRDQRGMVSALYLLDARYVNPLVSASGDIFYQLVVDNLAGIGQTDDLIVPASEIIHDRMNCLFHPLVGVSPLFASGRVADLSLKIESSSSGFFKNGARPGGILTAPGAIDDESAQRLKEYFEANYSGENAGRIAIVGDGLKFEPLRMTAAESQLIEQLKWGAEVICSTFHVPPYKIGIGAAPNYANVEAMQQDYYNTCLQTPIEEYEACMREGLDLALGMEVKIDLDGLLRMDTKTQIETLSASVAGSIRNINEARLKLNLPPVEGGDSIWMQQQDTSLSALAERDRNGIVAQKPIEQAPAVSAQDDEVLTDEEMDEAIAE